MLDYKDRDKDKDVIDYITGALSERWQSTKAIGRTQTLASNALISPWLESQ